MGSPDDAVAPGRVAGFAACRHEPIETAEVLEAVRHDSAGGNVLFVGTARGVTAGVATLGLRYDAHEPLAVATLDALRREAIERFDLVACAVMHRLGRVQPGEASVALAASAPHRAAAFAAAEWLMAAIKRDVPIWKAEERADGGLDWQHPESAPRPGSVP